MTADSDSVATRIRATVSALAQMEQQLQEIQAKVSGLGFFARGFVEKDVRGATGRGFSDWVSAAARLRSALSAAIDSDKSPVLAIIADELPRVAGFRQYLQRAPQKINLVPAAVLKPQQRAEFLRQVSDQELSLQALETNLRDISGALR